MSIFILFIGGWNLNKLVIENKIIKIPSSLPSIILFILCLPLLISQDSIQIFILIALSIYTYKGILKMNDLNTSKINFFNIGFFCGLLTLFNINLLIFYPLILLALVSSGQFNYKNMTVLFVGLIYQLLIFYSLKYFDFINLNLMYNSVEYKSLNVILNRYSEFIFITLIVTTVSAYELYINYNKKKEMGRRGIKILLFTSVIIILHAFIFQYFYLLLLLIIPKSIIISNYLLYTKFKNVRTFLLGLLITLLMINTLYL